MPATLRQRLPADRPRRRKFAAIFRKYTEDTRSAGGYVEMPVRGVLATQVWKPGLRACAS
jgi:hypothetical protein